MLELHMAGHLPVKRVMKKVVNEDGQVHEVLHKESIKELSGYSEHMIRRILRKDEVQYLRQQIMEYYDDEFQALYPKVVDSIRRGLNSDDKHLEAAKIYLREFGSASKKGPLDGASLNFTAEDMVFQILHQRSAKSGTEGSSTDIKADINGKDE